MKDTSHIREQLEQDIELYLAKGGKITVLAPQTFAQGYSDNVRKDFTINRDRGSYEPKDV